jgi:RNA polymerase sigma-70 factor (ECF subfamily)
LWRAERESQVTLEKAARAAAKAWPTLAPPPSFGPFLLARVPAGETLEHWLERAPLADLYLACACAEGSAAAMALFDAQHLARIGRFIARMRPSDDFTHEVAQTMREKLFVGTPGKRPKINDYVGMGTLSNWIRAMSVRTAIDLYRREPDRSSILEDEALSRDETPDPEGAQIKLRYRRQFSDALRRALDATSAEQRELLRLHFVESATFDQLAARFGMHKVTVWRRIAAARDAVLNSARHILSEELGLASGEFESLLHLLRSQLDFSLPSFLQAHS